MSEVAPAEAVMPRDTAVEGENNFKFEFFSIK